MCATFRSLIEKVAKNTSKESLLDYLSLDNLIRGTNNILRFFFLRIERDVSFKYPKMD